jgi:DNA-binding Lrp family transcriptional regulator
MIRHIVMFKLKDFPGETEKMKAAEEVIKRLNELPIKIEVIRKYEAGVDLRKLSWSYDIVLIMDFDNMTDLETYTVHPAHQEFIAFNKDYSVEKVCIDYEV